MKFHNQLRKRGEEEVAVALQEASNKWVDAAAD
jgi:hypothetical protein